MYSAREVAITQVKMGYNGNIKRKAATALYSWIFTQSLHLIVHSFGVSL